MPLGRRELLWLIVLTLVVTLLNAAKPLRMDDASFYLTANQIAHHPLDPYGFKLFWLQWPEPANWILSPPVLPYWWAIAIKLFGNSAVLWKLWLWPWVAAFVFSVHRLLKRFAGGMEMPLTWMTVLSPAFLPAVNLMTDVPAMGLGLCALCLGISAIEYGSILRAVVAGIAAGVAMETKYTAAIFPAVIFVYALLHRRAWIGCAVGLMAAILFCAWEVFDAHLYGRSQFVTSLGWNDLMWGKDPRSILWPAIVTLIGGVAPAIGLLGLVALDISWIILVGAVLVVFGAFAALAAAPVAAAVFYGMGAGVWIVVFVNLWRLRASWDKDDQFLLIWLGIEILAYGVISPFAAVRRVMGLVLVMTLVVGRLAAKREIGIRRRQRLGLVVAGGIMLGFGFYALDLYEAVAQKNAVQQTAAMIGPHPGETVWFVGHWELQFYAEQLGYQEIVPDHSLLRRGDWLVYPEIHMSTQHIGIPGDAIAEVGDVRIDDALRLTSGRYYASAVPLEHRDEARAWLSVHRITRDFVPPTTYSADVLVKWAATRGRALPPDSIVAVARAIREIDPAAADLSKAEGDSDLSVRQAAGEAEAKINQP
jgi:Dolichyl-phosphate-mannose-protein mannosyltransferase